MFLLNYKTVKSGMDLNNNHESINTIELTGKNLLVQWNIRFKEFGEISRFKKYFENNEAEPGFLITYKGKSALLDFEETCDAKNVVKENIVLFFKNCAAEFNMPAAICFMTCDKMNFIRERHFAVVDYHKYFNNNECGGDENKTVIFSGDLPVFNKEIFLKYIFK